MMLLSEYSFRVLTWGCWPRGTGVDDQSWHPPSLCMIRSALLTDGVAL